MAEVGKALYWTPRILGILITLLVLSVSFDIEGTTTIGEYIGDLFLHLIPAFLLIGILYYAWKRNELYGGMIFILLGFLYIATKRELIGIVMIALPLFIIGALFIENWRRKRSK